VISPYELIIIFFNMGFDLVLKGFHKLETKNYTNEKPLELKLYPYGLFIKKTSL
jgi:hypothetical protein